MIKFYDLVLAQLIKAMKRKVAKLDLAAARDFKSQETLKKAAEHAYQSALVNLEAAVALEKRAEKLEAL